MRTEIVPAQASMLERFDADLAGKSVRMLAAVRGDEVLGVAGIYRAEAGYIVFAKLSAELIRDRRAIVRGARALFDLARRCRAPLYAVRDPGIPSSDGFLRHLGFVPGQGDLWPHRGAD